MRDLIIKRLIKSSYCFATVAEMRQMSDERLLDLLEAVISGTKDEFVMLVNY